MISIFKNALKRPRLIVFALLICFLIPSIIYAKNGVFCNNKATFCGSPSVVSAFAIYKDFDVSFLPIVGIGYGVQFLADKFYSVGIDLLANFQIGGNEPSKGRISIVPSFFKYVRLGFGIEFQKGNKPDPIFIIGFGYNL